MTCSTHRTIYPAVASINTSSLSESAAVAFLVGSSGMQAERNAIGFSKGNKEKNKLQDTVYKLHDNKIEKGVSKAQQLKRIEIPHLFLSASTVISEYIGVLIEHFL